jgi:hypothetical protein
MTKLLAKFFKTKKNENHGRQLTDEERYIISRDPQSVLDVENFAKEFERKQSNQRSWSIL